MTEQPEQLESGSSEGSDHVVSLGPQPAEIWFVVEGPALSEPMRYRRVDDAVRLATSLIPILEARSGSVTVRVEAKCSFPGCDADLTPYSNGYDLPKVCDAYNHWPKGSVFNT